MYHDFSRQPDAAREFFFRYRERIIYGTDIDTRALARGASDFMRFIPWLIRSMLEKEGAFTAADGNSFHGLGLPREVLEKIYHANFERMFSKDPKGLQDL